MHADLSKPTLYFRGSFGLGGLGFLVSGGREQGDLVAPIPEDNNGALF